MQKYRTYVGKDGRVRAYVTDENNHTTVKSYPRILMEEKLGRPLDPNEDVHHIDGDVSNNNIDNLAIISHGVHQRMHNPQLYFPFITRCQICGKLFVWSSERQSNYVVDLRRGKSRAITCSRTCSYWFGIQEQTRRNFSAECELNGETFPNGNTVPNKHIGSIDLMLMCVENIHSPSRTDED